MLTTPTRLRDELVKLDRDLVGLGGRRAALVGFRDPNEKRVEDNLRSVAEAPGWTLVDARRSSPGQLVTALKAALGAPRLALLLDAAAPVPTDASVLIRAIHDARDSVTWVDRTASAIPDPRLLYVVACGARSMNDLPPVLQRIDFMIFIRSP
jgi:hypothetical protein